MYGTSSTVKLISLTRFRSSLHRNIISKHRCHFCAGAIKHYYGIFSFSDITAVWPHQLVMIWAMEAICHVWRFCDRLDTFRYQGPSLLTEISHTSIGIRAVMGNYININQQVTLLIHTQHSNFNTSLVKQPLKLNSGWVNISHRNQCLWLLIQLVKFAPDISRQRKIENPFITKW